MRIVLVLFAALALAVGCSRPTTPAGTSFSGAACPGPAPRPATPEHARQLLQTRSAARLVAAALSETNLLATIDDDGDIRVWDITHRVLIGSAKHPALHRAKRIVWAADGRTFAVITSPARQYTRVTWLDARAQTVAAACSTSGMTPLGSGAALHWIAREADHVVVLDEVTCTRKPFVLPVGVPANATLAISRDGTTLAAEVPEVPIWEVGKLMRQELVVWPYEHPERSQRLAIKPHRGTGTVAVSKDFAIVARGVGTAARGNPHRLMRVPFSTDPAQSFAELPDEDQSLELSLDSGLVAATSSHAGSSVVQVSSIAERRVLWQRSFGSGALVGALFTPHGEWLVVPTELGPVQVFDATTGRLYAELGTSVTARPSRVAFVADDVVAAASNDRVTLWSLHDGSVLQRERVTGVLSVGSTPNGDVSIARTRPDSDADFWVPPEARTRAERERGCPLDAWPIYSEAWDGIIPRTPGEDPLEASLAPSVPRATWPPGALGRTCVPNVRHVIDVDLSHARALVLEKNEYHLVDLRSGADVVLRDEPIYDRALFSRDGQRLVRFATEHIQLQDVPVVEVWDTKGKVINAWAARGEHIGVAQDSGAYAISSDGHVIAAVVGGTEGVVVVVYDLDWQHTLFEVQPNEPPTSVAFGASIRDLYLGTNGGELIHYRDGKEVGRGASAGGAIEDIAFDTVKGRSIATVSSDGAMRIWDPEAATERVTLVSFNDDEALAYTPNGAYTGTREASDRVVWVFDSPIEAFPFSQFAAWYEREDAVARRLAGENVDVSTSIERPPHSPELLDVTVAGATAHLRAHVSSPSRTRSLHAFVEGRPVESKLVCARDGDVAVDVPLLPGENVVALSVDDDHGLASNETTTRVRGPNTAPRPSIWIVAIGIDRYPSLPARFQLGYAAADARGIADVFGAQGTFYEHVHRRVLTDDLATTDSIRSALDELRDMQPQDIAIIFFGGHGVKPDGRDEMVFATGGVKSRSDGSLLPESLVTAGVGWSQIRDLLARARGRVVVLLDACHSGVVTTDVVQNGDLAAELMRDQRAGAVVFAAAKGRQLSYEPRGARGFSVAQAAQALVVKNEDGGHGYFTGALLQSLGSADTDRDRDGVVEISELITDVSRRVSTATVGHQTPWVARREIFGDFALAASPMAIHTTPSPPRNWDDEPALDACPAGDTSCAP